MSFGKYTYGNPTNIFYENENTNSKLIIGNFCSISKNVNIYLGGNKRTDCVTTFPFGYTCQNIFNSFQGNNNNLLTNGDVNIGNDVQIGDNVTIMSGVTIGDGAIISNNSFVENNVEPYSINKGNPLILVNYRFTSIQIEKLLEIKWWYWDDEKINSFTNLLCNNNIDEFIDSANVV